MQIVNEPTYTNHITGELKRFDDRNTGFSRGAVEGDKYTRMHDNSVLNIAKQATGKTILDHATWVAGRTVDHVVRRNLLGRDIVPIYNKKYRLKHPDATTMAKIIKEKASWIGADKVGVAKLNPLWIYTHWGIQNVTYSRAAEAGDPIEIPSEYKTVRAFAERNILTNLIIQADQLLGYGKFVEEGSNKQDPSVTVIDP